MVRGSAVSFNTIYYNSSSSIYVHSLQFSAHFKLLKHRISSYSLAATATKLASQSIFLSASMFMPHKTSLLLRTLVLLVVLVGFYQQKKRLTNLVIYSNLQNATPF